jgi:putative two-component system response regulator
MSSDRKTIFLVDDDITNLAIGNNTLSGHFNIFTLNSGARLLKMLEKRIPDLILLDVEMPDMNGYETLKFIKEKEETRNIPVIFLTAQSDDKSELDGLALGAIDYILKPFSPPLLLKRLELHLQVESQKQHLTDINKNLQKIIDDKTRTAVELKDAYLKSMSELVEFRDYITGGHIDRTQFFLSLLLDGLENSSIYMNEISGWDTDLVLRSAQLYNIGNISIKDNILKKPGHLNRQEFEEIKLHVPAGERVIDKISRNSGQKEFLEQAKIVISSHHEKWDGSGYPRGLKGNEIPLQGRLMAIADVYEALVSNRPYRKALSHEEAVSLIARDSGKHFDPALIDLFISISDRFNNISHREYLNINKENS